MPKAIDIIKAAAAAADDTRLNLVITPRHYEWLARGRRGQELSDAAIAHALRVLRNEDVPPPGHRFSGSRVTGLHGVDWSCHRYALFAYAKAPKLEPTPVQKDNMNLGSWDHLAWQVEGLSAGYLTSCETWDTVPELNYGAKDDGLVVDDSLLELKFVKGTKYEQVRKGARYGPIHIPAGPTTSNIYQVTGLMWLKDLAYCSLVYVNRENGEFTEFRLARESAREQSFLEVLTDLNDWVELDELPPMLPGCASQSSTQYRNCEYRQHCPKARTVSIAAPPSEPYEFGIDPADL